MLILLLVLAAVLSVLVELCLARIEDTGCGQPSGSQTAEDRILLRQLGIRHRHSESERQMNAIFKVASDGRM